MIRPVSASRPIDALRHSSDQARRAAELLAEITDETGAAPSWHAGAPAPDDAAVDLTDPETAREATIQRAQRSFASGLRPSQVLEGRPRE